MSCIAIITARGGSKRIPRKNVKEFCGKPIISYSIDAAVKSGIFDEVMVSTDDNEIAKVARLNGASVPFLRSPETSNDFADTADVLIEVLGEYKKLGKEFDYLACLYPTAPFITPEKLVNGMKILKETGADSLIPVVKFGYPPQRAYLINNGQLKFQYPEYIDARSQDLEPIYHDVGQFYFCRTEQFLKHKTLIMPNLVPLIVPEEESQDIDNESDWLLAEIKYRQFIEKKD